MATDELDPGPAVPDRRSPLPLWAQIAADLRRRLAAGAFDPGFPPEHHLVAQSQVSRHTIREALRELRATGLVVAERGRTSFVDRTRIEQPLGALYSLFRVVQQQGMAQHSEVLRLERDTDARVAGHLGLPPDTELVVLARRRLADGQPLALDTTWLPAAIAAPLLAVDFTDTALYDELARRCGVRVQGGRERIQPALPDPRQCALLGVPRHTPVFELHRLGCADGRPVEWRESVVRGDRFAFVAEWSPQRPDLELTAERLPADQAPRRPVPRRGAVRDPR